MKLTEVEKIILKNTDEQYKYIARDSNGELNLYSGKPKKFKHYWYEYFYIKFNVFDHLFQDIKWEDEEPLRFRNEKGELIL